MFDLDSVKELFKTEPNTAFFWSGLGENGAEIAKEVARSNGGVTLEMLMEKNKQQLIDAGFPYNNDLDDFVFNGNDPENLKAWTDISEAYASQVSGNVRAVLGENIRSDSVWCQHEIPRLFNNDSVPYIQGISKQQLINSHDILCEINKHDANFAIGNSISDIPINNTDLDYFTNKIISKYNLSSAMDKEIIDKFTAYEHLTSINADSVKISKLGILTDPELFSKYSFLNDSVSQSILDEFRVGEYRLKTTGVDTLTSKNLYFDNNGLLVSIDKKVPNSVFETTIGEIRNYKSDADMRVKYPEYDSMTDMDKLIYKVKDNLYTKNADTFKNINVSENELLDYARKLGKSNALDLTEDEIMLYKAGKLMSTADDVPLGLVDDVSKYKKLSKISDSVNISGLDVFFLVIDAGFVLQDVNRSIWNIDGQTIIEKWFYVILLKNK